MIVRSRTTRLGQTASPWRLCERPSHLGVGGSNVFPIVGDWNNDLTDTVGIYKNSNCVVYLKNTNASGPADITFCFGPSGSQYRPVSGDWDNNGTDGFGIYDTSNGATFLRNSLTNGPGDVFFMYGMYGMYGAAGFTPVAGAWDNLP